MIKKDNFGTRSNSKLAASGPIKAGTTNANLGGKSVVARANTPAQDPNLGRLVLTTIIQDIPKYSIDGEGNQVAINYTSLQIPKEKELRHPLVAGIQVSLVSGNFSQLITITSTLALNDTTISVASFNPNVDIGKGALICIDEEDLFNQYQNKTKGTIAGFTVDSDGIAKSGIEITDWLNSDTMTGASVNNVPTALSVKNYVDNSHPAEDQTLQEVTDNGNTTTNSVMIGSSSSPTHKLDISGGKIQINDGGATWFGSDGTGGFVRTFNGNTFRFLDSSGGETMRIDNTNDRVGIGTSSPSDELEVYKNGSDVAIRIHEDAGTHEARLHLRRGGSDWELINNYNFTIEGEGVERFRIDTAGLVGIGTSSPSSILELASATPIITLNSTEVLVSQGIEWRNSGNLDAFIKQGPSNGTFEFNVGRNSTWGGDFKFVSDTYNSYLITRDSHKWYILGVQKMCLTSAGNLGIGTSSPASKLHLYDGDFRITGVFPRIYLQDSNNDSDFSIINGNGNLRFYDDTNAVDRLYISAAGNVGIGSNSPNRLLTLSASGGTYQAFNSTSNNNTTIGSDGTGAFIVYDDTASSYRMVVKETTGNVLIGTTTDSGAKLQVVGKTLIDSSSAGALTIDGGTGVGTNGTLIVQQNGTGANNGIAITSSYATSHRIWKNSTGDLNIGPSSSSSALVQKVNGNLLIGTTSDNGQKLNVDGSGRFTGTAFLEGEVKVGTTSGANLNFLRTSANYISATNATGYLVFRTGGYDTALTLDASQNASFAGSLTGTTATFSGDVNISGYINHIGDAGTKFGFEGNDAFRLYTANALMLQITASTHEWRIAGGEKMRLTSAGNLLIGTTTNSGEKLQVNGTATFGGQVTIPATPVATTDAASKSYVDSQVAEAGTSSFGSFTPASTQSIASGGNVGVKSTLLLATSQVTASNITTSSAGLTFANAGLYQISFNFASKVSGTANRTLAAANLEYSTDGETWTEIVGSLVYNYDRGTATSGGASSWGFVYDGSASCSFIHNLATSSIIRARFWIEGRASSASGITTIINGCRLSAHKIG